MAIIEEDLMKFRNEKEERDRKNIQNDKIKEERIQKLKSTLTQEEYAALRKDWRLRDEKNIEFQPTRPETQLEKFKRLLLEK